MSSLIEKEKVAIERLRAFEPPEGYFVCISGGKDSDVIRILAQLAGVKHELHHNLTTVDAPETVRYVQSIPGIIIDKSTDKNGDRITMWNLIERKLLPPTRLMRYCCESLKEHGGKGRLKVTGVRWEESHNRQQNRGLLNIIGKPRTAQKQAEELGAIYEKTQQGGIVMNHDNDENRRLVEHCYRTTSTMLNPIIDWTESEVWAFLRHYGCPANPLYQCGKNRVGCICCPMQGGDGMKRDGALYPKYKAAYIRAFDRMLKRREEAGKPTTWESGLEVWKWWVGDDPNQLSFFEEEQA